MLGIIARTLVVVVLPVVSVVLLDNSCFAWWTQLWKPCLGENKKWHKYFRKTEEVDYFLDYAGTFPDLVPEFATIELSVLDKQAVCGTNYQPGKCARGVLEILYPLFTSKLIYAILIAALKPLLMALWRRRRVGASAATAASSQVATPGPEPDPMQALIWYETAFIFGCLAPLMVVLVAAQLYADAIAFEWKLRRAPSTMMPSWWGAKPLPILRGVLKVHLVLVLFLQSAMVVFFFVDNRLCGWQVVAMVVPLLFVADLAYGNCHAERRQQPGSQQEAESPLLRGSSGGGGGEEAAAEVGILESGDVAPPRIGIRIGTEVMHSPMHPWGGDYLEEPLLGEEERKDRGGGGGAEEDEEGQ